MKTSLPRADINVTPMIDVMLVLLIIFMVVVPAIASVVALPLANNADSRPEEPGDITLLIDRSGTYRLQTVGGAEGAAMNPDRIVPDSRLAEVLGALYQNRERDRILYLKADSTLGFGVVERAMGIARDAGVRVVAAVTERKVTRN